MANGRRQRWWTLAAILIGTGLLAACAAPRQPVPIAFSASGTAIVRTGISEKVYLFGSQSVAITRVDDTSLVDRDNRPLYRSVEVYPGLHTIYFVYRHTGFCVAGASSCAMRLTRQASLTFEAEPGRVYRVVAFYGKGGLQSWIVDENAGAVVAGHESGGGDWASQSQSFGLGTGSGTLF